MQISELLTKCTLADSDMNEVLSANPKQIISDSVEIPCWRVLYEYDTARGNRKDGTKYLFLAESAWDLVEPEFNRHIEKINEKRPFAKISNVKILDVQFIGSLYLELE